MTIDSEIKQPKLKSASVEELSSLAAQLRQRIIDVCSKNGGHIGASLGAVELTLALHSEFESPRDSIIWDIGHQAYAHKILTSRGASFETLRKKNGLSGFTSREESIHDVFGAGHSSTSVSAALGIAEAKRIKQDSSWTVAIIGDGALTSGLSFEAFNQAGASVEPRLLIIINDNNLSISQNVGALDKWAFGTERAPRNFFESMGFEYSGPIDGHDLVVLKKQINEIKKSQSKKVFVLHVLTKKGKGFAPAEKDPTRFHGVGPFDKLTGLSGLKSSGVSYSKVFGNALTKLASKDNKVVAITAAMAEGTGLVEFEQKHPEKFFDVGIAEPHAVVFAAGLATQGLKPVVAIYSTFLQRAVDGIIHDIALQNLAVTLCVDRAGLVGADGPTHHGLFDIPILRAIPNTTIIAPSNKQDLEDLLGLALDKPGLKIIRYPRGTAVDRSFRNVAAKWGKASILLEGDQSDVDGICIWALGNATQWALEAISLIPEAITRRLKLIDAKFVKPLDLELLKSTSTKQRFLLTLEDGSMAGGFGSAVLEAITELNMHEKPRVKILGIPDRWIKHAEISEQREELGLSAAQIARTIEDAFRS